VKKRGSQVGKLDQLKTIVLHNDRDDELHITQTVEFVTVDLISVDD